MRDVEKILPIILSDGKGRWPRRRFAKQDRSVSEDLDLKLVAIAQTSARFETDMFHPPVFICQEGEAELIEQKMREAGMNIGGIIVEPEDRETTASVAIAAYYAQRYDPDAMVLLTLADYQIAKPMAFRRHIAAATPVVRDGYVVTFGAPPHQGETRHGHIRKGQVLRPGTFLVEDFCDSSQDAATMSAQYYSNSGMYLAEPALLLTEFEIFEPDLMRAAKKAFEKAKLSKSMMHLRSKYYRDCTAISFDRAIMERTKRAAIIPADIGWRDLGHPTIRHQDTHKAKGFALL